MKTGYAAGAVAGFIVGIPALIFGVPIIQMIGFGLSLSEVLEILPFTATMHIVFNTFWGLVWGVLFAKFYDVIPGASSVKKGLMWGLVYAVVEWWCGSLWLVNGFFAIERVSIHFFANVLLWAVYGPVVILFYGLPFGYLYEGTKQPVKLEDKRKHKPIAGMVAGLVGGIVAAVLTFNQLIMGIPFLWYWPDFNPPALINVATEFVIMFFWGIIFNVIFVLLYARIPGKDVMKGLYYGLLLYLITWIYWIISVLLYAGTTAQGLQAVGYSTMVLCLAYISYGIVLGYFYKKK